MSRKQLIAYLGCSVSIGVFGAFNNFTLTLWLSGFTSSYLLLGLLGNSRSFEGTLVAPVAGAWSDKVWLGWLGRRRPFILAGGLSSALLLALTPVIAAWHAPAALGWLNAGTPGLVPAVIAIFLFTLTFNAMGDIHEALMVDVTGPAERNRLSALRVVVGMAAQVSILVFGFVMWRHAVPASAFAVVAAIMAGGVLVTVFGVKEPAPAQWDGRRADAPHAAKPPRPSLQSFVHQYRGAALFCLVAFCYWSGVNAVLPLISVYTRDILHANTGEAQLLPALLLLSTTLLALPAAKLGNRFGKRRVMSAGFAIVAVAGLLALVITTKEQGAFVFLLAGVGNAAGQVLTVPLLADLVPRRDIGKATGILAASGSLAAPIASLTGGALAGLFGPRAIFAMMAVTVTAALILLQRIHPAGDALGESETSLDSLQAA